MATQNGLELAHGFLVRGVGLEVTVHPGFKFSPGCHIVGIRAGKPAQHRPLAAGQSNLLIV